MQVQSQPNVYTPPPLGRLSGETSGSSYARHSTRNYHKSVSGIIGGAHTRRNRQRQPVYEKNGWKCISISGTPRERGFSHGRLLYRELRRLLQYLPFLVKTDFDTTVDEFVHRCKRLFYTNLTKHYREYMEELAGISEGAKSKGVDISIDILLAWNAFLSMYSEYEKGTSENSAVEQTARCSAFIATGKSTESGEIVMAHNTHCHFAFAPLSNIIMYVYPEQGVAFCMQTCAGLLSSTMDWFICANGMVGCETTIYGIKYKPVFGIPYFCRIRDCMQYGNSLDEYATIMLGNNSGDYACSWLFGDSRTGEIMLCEIGLNRYNIQKTKSGVYYGMNSAIDVSLRLLETNDTHHADLQSSLGARNARFDYLLNDHYAGRITVNNARRIIGDHYDVFENRAQMGVRGICKHAEMANEPFMKHPYYPQGTIDGKVTDTKMIRQMSFYGKFGSSCNRVFKKREYLAKHPIYAEWKKYLVDLPNQPWTRIVSPK
jgi:hypothetical protein